MNPAHGRPGIYRGRGASRRRSQRGLSLIESVVASALMGLGVVAGLTAWDTASMSANRAVRLAWAHCIVRAELDTVFSGPFAASYAAPAPFSTDHTVQVTVVSVRGVAGVAAPSDEQQVVVSAYDPQSGALLDQVTALKVRALQGRKDLNTDAGVRSDVMLGCPAR